MPSPPSAPATLRPLASVTVTSPSVPEVALTTTGSLGSTPVAPLAGLMLSSAGVRRRRRRTTTRSDDDELEPATLSVAGLSTLPEQPATRARPATTVAATASRAP